MENAQTIMAMTGTIVSSFVSANTLSPTEVPALVKSVYDVLAKLAAGGAAASDKPVPFVDPAKSVFKDYIVCLEDGKKFKSLKRYLASTHNMTPSEYRQRWGLPADYPMVAPSYSRRRSELAKSNGLGRKAGAVMKAPQLRKAA